ncbi:MAG: hypothetical protein AAF108_03510 [Planctomycetota bacterium]
MQNMYRALAVAALAGSASAQSLDGSNLAADAAANGLDLLAVQDTATQFGNSSGADQGAPFGSELNAAWGGISNGMLNLSIAGNLEANFNKLWIFFDAVDGGFNQLPTDAGLVDGGFNEINNLGVTFDSGFEADHGIRIEVGDGFFGLNQFDLLDVTAGSIISGGGPAELPLSEGAGNFGTTVGWDNANGAGVSDSDAADPLSSDSGWEFAIDLAAFFGDAGLSEIKATAFVSNGGGDFVSNQVLGGVGGADNLAGSPDFSQIDGDQFVTIVPAPASAALLGLSGVLAGRRRG